MTKQIIFAFTALAFLVKCPTHAQLGDKRTKEVKGQYANVNGVKMYYEVHGTGRPLVVLHGAFGWATAYPACQESPTDRRRATRPRTHGRHRTPVGHREHGRRRGSPSELPQDWPTAPLRGTNVNNWAFSAPLRKLTSV